MNDVYIIESWLGEVQQLWSTGIHLLMRGLDGVRVDVVGWGAGDRRPGAARRGVPAPAGPSRACLKQHLGSQRRVRLFAANAAAE